MPRFQPELSLECLYHDERTEGVLYLSSTTYFCNPVHVFEAVVMIDGGERDGETLKQVCVPRALPYEPEGEESHRQRVARLTREAIARHDGFVQQMIKEFPELAAENRAAAEDHARIREEVREQQSTLADTVLRYLATQPKGTVPAAWVRELAEATGFVATGAILLDAEGNIENVDLVVAAG